MNRSWKAPAVAAGRGAGGEQRPWGGAGGAAAGGGLLRDAPLGRCPRLRGRPGRRPPAGSQALPVLLLCLLRGGGCTDDSIYLSFRSSVISSAAVVRRKTSEVRPHDAMETECDDDHTLLRNQVHPQRLSESCSKSEDL